MLGNLDVNHKVCDYFEGSYALGSDGSLTFLYSSGEYEALGPGFHYIPYSCGYWKSHSADMNLRTNVIIVRSALNAVEFLNQNHTSFNLESLLVISIGCASVFPAALKGMLKRKKVYFLFGGDILGIATQIKLGFFLLEKNISINLEDEMLLCKLSSVSLVFSIKTFSLNKLLKSLKIGNQFRILKHHEG